jgi:F0F1-type ATP synthase assembly protein I
VKKQFGKRKPYIDKDRERAAAAKVAILLIAGAVAAFGLGYLLDDPKGGSAFAYIFGFAELVVAIAAAHDAFGLDIDEEI